MVGMNEPLSEKAENALREIGLTENEIRAYLLLLQAGLTTASQISERAGIPYSKVYEVLNSLEAKGWIKTEPGRPRRYYPRAPSEALEEARLRFANRVEAWRKSVFEELQPIYDKREIRERPDVWILRGELDTVAKIKEMTEKARNELMVAVPVLPKPFVQAALPLFRNLVDSGVKLFVMVSREQRSGLGRLLGFGEVRVRDNMFGGGIIADGREALLILGEKKSPLIIWSDHLGLVKFAKDYFQYLWNTADKP
jgi:sugar-specific transcriptional regulator TrmB